MDVLRKNGYVPLEGDVIRNPNQNRSGFVGVSVNPYGMYSVLDRINKKIFTYNEEGYLNYVTGFEGEFEGNFIFPTSIKYDEELIIVADSTQTRTIITVFEPTEFGQLVNQANYLTYIGDSIDASSVWKDILSMNSNFSLAYIGIGHSYYRQKDYINAMESYRLGQDRINYSKAYKENRRIEFENSFSIVATVVGLIIVVALFYPIIKDLKKD
jgi:tetratricopeptide (TPR) repeat protein